MKRNFIKVPLLLTSLILTGCKPSVTCDPDFEDCDYLNAPTMKEDNSKNYLFDESITNKNGSVNYEIFIRSFYDSDGDGIGDFNGVKEKLPYLKEMGIKNIWLMPFNKSGSYHGYDVIDYYAVEDDYGTIDDLKSLIDEAKTLDIGITMDLVINHSSKLNKWFLDSYSDASSGVSGDNSKADWYNWSYEAKSGYHQYRDLYYEGAFDASMPDLNLDSVSLKEEIKNVVKYWLDFGISGFRLDAVLYYYQNNTSANTAFLKWLNDYVKEVNKDAFLVGECWANNDIINEYYKSGAESFFDFGSSIAGSGKDALVGIAKGTFNAKSFSKAIENKEKIRKENNPHGYSSYFLSNHDMDRISKNATGDNAKACASLYLLLPGTPYIYYGEEIELVGVRGTSPDDRSDVKRRLPMVWKEHSFTGKCQFPEKNRQDLNNTKQVEKGVEDMLVTDYSLLNHYKKVINIRNKYPLFKYATYIDLTSGLNTENEHVFAYELKENNKSIVIVHNFNDYNVEVDISKFSSTILDEINTTKKIPELNNGLLKLGAKSTVILNKI